MACADTGSDVNIISVEDARALAQDVREDAVQDESFVLANGRIVRPIGKVMIDLCIGHQIPDLENMTSHSFYVFPKATTIIMGMPFLEEKKLMTENRHTLIKCSRQNAQSLSVYSIGRPRKHLLCEVNHEITVATPDSGSEVDLMSPIFAIDRGFEIHETSESIELADGSVLTCTKFVRTTLSIGSHFDSMGAPRSKTAANIDFFLLEGLNHDVIIGDYHLDYLKVFTDNRHALIFNAQDHTIAEINSIRRLGAIDNAISWVKRKLRSDKPGVTRQHGMWAMLCFKTYRADSRLFEGSSTIAGAVDDQRENDRHEREMHRIAALPTNEQQASRDAELLKYATYTDTSNCTS
jgi:hypothetical protein